jgi:hypothetical protein
LHKVKHLCPVNWAILSTPKKIYHLNIKFAAGMKVCPQTMTRRRETVLRERKRLKSDCTCTNRLYNRLFASLQTDFLYMCNLYSKTDSYFLYRTHRRSTKNQTQRGAQTATETSWKMSVLLILRTRVFFSCFSFILAIFPFLHIFICCYWEFRTSRHRL